MRCELTLRSGRTRPADVRSSDSETLSRIRSLAAYIIVTRGSDFSEASASGFTVRPLCRSGHSPVGRLVKHSQSLRQWLAPGGVSHFETFHSDRNGCMCEAEQLLVAQLLPASW